MNCRVDRDADGKLNEAEVKEVESLFFIVMMLYVIFISIFCFPHHVQIISLSASANELENIRRQADEYAALIMETLDPYHYGYIMVCEVL